MIGNSTNYRDDPSTYKTQNATQSSDDLQIYISI